MWPSSHTSSAIELDADEGRLVQALQNLLVNAVKFNKGGREMQVRARRDPGEAVVTVTDSGIGLDAAELESIFALFAQCEQTVSAHANRGLGSTPTLSASPTADRSLS